MSRIYWDTMMFVYLLEDHPLYSERVAMIRARMFERGDNLCTSIFTVGEVLTGPYKRGDDEVAERIRSAFRGPGTEILPYDENTAVRYARIRSTTRVKPADAIHLASAAEAGTDLFVTNDDALKQLIVPGIHFIAGLDVNLF